MKSRLMLITVVVSIAFNFALVGFLLGKQTRPLPGFDPTRGHVRWMQTLPSARRDELRPVLHNSFKPVRRLNLRRIHRQFRDTLLAQPFNQDELSQALHELRQSHNAALQISHADFVQLVSALTLEERQNLAKTLATHPRKRHIQHRKRLGQKRMPRE